MLKFFYNAAPNPMKVALLLEELGLAYEAIPVDTRKGEQFKPEFLKISPNNRIPAIVDTEPSDEGETISIFESGAILQYLARKTGKFYPADERGRVEVGVDHHHRPKAVRKPGDGLEHVAIVGA